MWKRGLKFLQIEKESIPAAVHSIVVYCSYYLCYFEAFTLSKFENWLNLPFALINYHNIHAMKLVQSFTLAVGFYVWLEHYLYFFHRKYLVLFDYRNQRCFLLYSRNPCGNLLVSRPLGHSLVQKHEKKIIIIIKTLLLACLLLLYCSSFLFLLL